MFEDNGNKCGKCQNHDFEVLKKGHARDCPFKKCDCLKCRLLDARSDILQVISGKETKLKGTKKDPNCGYCQNHNIKILRKGHVRSCGFGQERHFKLENCFDCEVHYIRNEVNRLQIKMRRAMKEDRALSEEQRKTAREPITRDEVEKVCDMARLARKKREAILAQQVGESSSSAAAATAAHQQHNQHHQQQQRQRQQQRLSAQVAPTVAQHLLLQPPTAHGRRHQATLQHQQQQMLHLQRPTCSTPSSPASLVVVKDELAEQLGASAAAVAVWRPWSQHQVRRQSCARGTQAALGHQAATTFGGNGGAGMGDPVGHLHCALPSNAATNSMLQPQHLVQLSGGAGSPCQQPFWQGDLQAPLPQLARLRAPQSVRESQDTQQRSIQEQQLFTTIFGLLVAQFAQPNAR